MATLDVLASESGSNASHDANFDTYSIARNGTGTIDVTTDWAAVGQNHLGIKYQVYQGYLGFALTDPLLAGATITAAVLSLYDASDNSTTDFEVQARAHAWGGTVETTDYVAGGSLSGKTLLAHGDTSGHSAGSYWALTDDAMVAAAQAAIGSTLRMLLCSKRTVDNTAPGAAPSREDILPYGTNGSSVQKPKLSLTYTPAPGSPNRRGVLLGIY